MGFLARAVAEQKSMDPLAVWAEMLRVGRSSMAGPTITLETALKVATMFACLRVLSQGVAQVPLKVFREVEQGGLKKIEAAKDHRLYDLLAFAPNDWTTSFEFRETQTIHAALGNSYAFINRTMGGISELILLNPGRVKKVQKPDYRVVFEVTGETGAVQEFPAEAIWHVRGPSWDGLLGLDVLSLAREALGLAIATEESHAKLHAKGVRTSGTYSIEGKLNKEQYAALKAWILAENAGAENAGVPMILDNGAKWISGALSGVDAQHLETRKHQIEEVCRFMGVHPQKVFHTDKTSTYASAEEFSNAHREDTLGPWYMRIEQSADLHLLTRAERRKGLYCKHVANALMRASAKDRAEYYAKALGSGGHPGWMTPDQVRELEEMNPMGGEAAKLPLGSNGQQPAPAMDENSGKTAVKSLLEEMEKKLDKQSVHVTTPVTVSLDSDEMRKSVKTYFDGLTKAAMSVLDQMRADAKADPMVIPAPQVTVINDITSAAPEVTVNNTVQPAEVKVTLPARKTTSETKIERDGSGNIIKSSTQSTEKDA